MTTKEKSEFVKMLMWAIKMIWDKNPEVDMCFDDIRKLAAIAWYELTGIDVR